MPSCVQKESKRERNFLVAVDEYPAVNFDAKTCVHVSRETFTSSSLNGHHQVIVIFFRGKGEAWN
jgi:galactose-1-phosphate uridylyltransferase